MTTATALTTAFDADDTAAWTVDVFDTALTRCWARPEHLFLACAQRLRAVGLTDLGDEAWMHTRQAAERAATATAGADLATLEDIYVALAPTCGWGAAEAAAALAIEVEVELDSVRPVPRLLALCRHVARAGRPLRFLSDMYLPEAVVARMLEAAGHRVEPGQVWVSAGRRASKRNGQLFAQALAAWKDLSPQQVLHLGDHATSDVRQARRAGLRAQQVVDAALPASARAVLEVQAAPLPLRSLMAGAIRSAWLQRPASADAHAEGLWQLGACHAGPLLTVYVGWLLQRAAQAGLKRLYFLARDGQVLLEIAQHLQAAGIGDGIALRYLHASRQAWFAPSLTQWTEDALFRVLDEPDRLDDPAKLARRLGFADAAALARRWPDVVAQLGAPMDNRAVARLLARTVPPEQALAHTASLRGIVLEHLDAHGLFDGVPWAIVDLGWRGRMQECLARIVGSHPDAAVHGGTGFYFGLLESPRDMPPGWQALAFASQGTGPAPLPGPAHLLELLCEADHGTTRGYTRDANGRVQAVFDRQADPAVLAWGLATYREAVGAYARELARSLPMLATKQVDPAAWLALAQTLGRGLFARTEPAAAAALARMPCSYSVTHDDAKELAAPLGRLDAWCRALTLGRVRLSGQRTAWLPGSLARSDARACRWHARLHRLAEKLRARLSTKPASRGPSG